MLQDIELTDPSTADTLACQAAQFILGDVQPTAVFRRKAKVNSPNVGTCPLGFESFLKRHRSYAC